METTSRTGGAHLEKVQSNRGRSVRGSGENALPIVVLPLTPSSTGIRCHGTDVAKALSVCISLNRSSPGSSTESPPEWSVFAPGSPVLAGPSLVLGSHSPFR